jgi:hypothetical protein
MIDSTRRLVAPNGLPASDQQRFAAPTVSCANVPRRLQEFRSRRRAHAGPGKVGRAVGTLLDRRKVAKHCHHRPRAELHARSCCHRRRSRARRLLRTANQCVSRPLLSRAHKVALTASGIMRYAEKPPPEFILISQNRQQDIDRRPRRTTIGSMRRRSSRSSGCMRRSTDWVSAS